jgi:hypothetical protein
MTQIFQKLQLQANPIPTDGLWPSLRISKTKYVRDPMVVRSVWGQWLGDPNPATSTATSES